jgi:alpha-glucosidase
MMGAVMMGAVMMGAVMMGAVMMVAAALVCPGAAFADGLTVNRDRTTLSVTAISPDVMRVRIVPDGQTVEDASWAVPAAVRAARAPTTVANTTLATGEMRAIYDAKSHRLHFEDMARHTLFAEAPQPLLREGPRFTLGATLTPAEHIYGLGDKPGPLDRRGMSFVDWNTDAFGFGSGSDPIYKSIPFFIVSGGAGGAYGILLDNTWRSWFDFGHRTPDRLEMGSENGPIDYYVIAGPTLGDVTRRYADLTGHAPLPPRWALGYQQSRYSYMSEAEVRALADRLHAERIPTDVIWLDIDYQDRNRPFTVNTASFPHFGQMVHDLDAGGIKTIAIVDLHVADAPGQGYAPYDSGAAADQFLHRADGSVYVGPVWPGPSVFPEFTSAKTRSWWGTLFQTFVAQGVAGFWNDMNEPAIFDTPTRTMPEDVRHRIASDDFAPRTATHAEIHNVYGMQNTRATYEGLRSLAPDERAFVMTRATYAGGQRYAATWTGDNSATWDHLKLAISQTLNLGLSGFVWTGTDVGGFAGGPPPDLLTKWFEYSAFLPVFRDHSAKGAPRAEPWVDGPEQLAIRRRYVEARYRLMPFLYALAEANARTGSPLARPVVYDYPGTDVNACDTTMSFTLGGSLLVAGAPRPEQKNSYEACLPAGGWYDYWTGEAVKPVPSADGPFATLTLMPALDMLPVFVRAGTILPRAPLTQSTSERPDGPLQLDVYAGPDCHGEIYDDDGHTMGFTHGAYIRQRVTCEAGPTGVTGITLAPREGSYAPWWRQIAVTIHSVDNARGNYSAQIAGKPLSDAGARNSFLLADQPAGARIELARR